MTTGGDITEITWTNANGNGRFFPLAGQGNVFDQGGIRTTDEDGGIAGDGQLVLTKNRMRSSFTVVVVNDMVIRDDASVAQGISESPEPTTFTFSVINGVVWKGTGTIVGDIKPDVNTSQLSLKFAMGTLEKL
jgi:hypothetical protein